MSGKTTAITHLLTQTETLGREEVAKQLLPLVYDDLKEQAQRYLRGERPGHTFQPTALVHEAFLKLVDQERVDWQGKTHFMAVGAAIMRRILIDHARTRKRIKRGGAWNRVELGVAEVAVEWSPVDPVDLGRFARGSGAAGGPPAHVLGLLGYRWRGRVRVGNDAVRASYACRWHLPCHGAEQYAYVTGSGVMACRHHAARPGAGRSRHAVRPVGSPGDDAFR